MKNLFILLLALALTSCEDFFMQRVDNPDVETQIYSVCILEPGMDQIRIPVYWTTPLFGPEVDTRGYTAINNANVLINGNGYSYTLAYEPSSLSYVINCDSSFIQTSKTYTLEITADGKTSRGSTTVPEFTASDVKMRYEVSKLGFDQDEILVFYSEFKDQIGKGHYYLTSGYFSTDTSFVGDENRIEYDPMIHTQSDKHRDGNVLKQIGEGYLYNRIDYIKTELTIECLSRDLFFHNQSMNSYASWYYDPENPFVEPTIAHDNMDGGIGVIGSRNYRTYTFLF